MQIRQENNTRNSVVDLTAIKESGLQEYEVRKFMKELGELSMITIEPRIGGADLEGKPYRLAKLTIKGLKELQDEDER